MTSIRNLVLLAFVGLCASQVALARNPVAGSDFSPISRSDLERALIARERYERGVEEMLIAAKENLLKILRSVQDAARASVETVWGYYDKLEGKVLDAGTHKLNDFGIDVNLTSVAALFKIKVKTCVKEEKIQKQGQAILEDFASCIVNDIDSLREMMTNMQDLWATAQTLPDVMVQVAGQCREHADDGSKMPSDLLNDLLTDDVIHDTLSAMVGGDPFEVLRNSDSSLASAVRDAVVRHLPDGALDVVGDAVAHLTQEEDAHELAAKANELLRDAGKVLNKRMLWNFARMTRCVQSVYSLSKSDLVHVPGKIVETATTAYRVYRSAQTGVGACVAAKTPTQVPAVIALSVDLGLCVGQLNLDDLVGQFPALETIVRVKELAERIRALKDVSPEDEDFIPKAMAEIMPPSARKALISAKKTAAIYNDLKQNPLDGIPFFG